ncbi:MAG: hypothetical protein ACHQQS_01390 [Thermoanaerobaculales bacterium]
MKTLLVVIVVVLAALVVYNYATTGRFTIVPAQLESRQTRDLNLLEDRLLAAESRFEAAGRGAALSGVDFSSEVSAVMSDVDRLEAELRDLRPRLSEEEKHRADKLQERITELKRRLR